MEYSQDRDIAYWNSKLALHLTISFFISVVGTIVGAMIIPPSAANMCGIIAFIALIAATFFRRRQGGIPMTFTYVFMFLEGISLYPVLLYYLNDLGANVFISIFATGTIVFGLLWFYSLTTKKDFSGFGGALFACLLAIVISSALNIFFFRSTGFDLIISIISVVIFTIYVLYDISIFKKSVQMGAIREINDLSIFVINLYLDLINILLNLLSILSNADD